MPGSARAKYRSSGTPSRFWAERRHSPACFGRKTASKVQDCCQVMRKVSHVEIFAGMGGHFRYPAEPRQRLSAGWRLFIFCGSYTGSGFVCSRLRDSMTLFAVPLASSVMSVHPVSPPGFVNASAFSPSRVIKRLAHYAEFIEKAEPEERSFDKPGPKSYFKVQKIYSPGRKWSSGNFR